LSRGSSEAVVLFDRDGKGVEIPFALFLLQYLIVLLLVVLGRREEAAQAGPVRTRAARFRARPKCSAVCLIAKAAGFFLLGFWISAVSLLSEAALAFDRSTSSRQRLQVSCCHKPVSQALLLRDGTGGGVCFFSRETVDKCSISVWQFGVI
jgi:hypothetical protein